MKKLNRIIISSLLVFVLAGCGSNESSDKTETPKSEEKTNSNLFAAMESTLKNNGFTITDTIDMAADMVGGESGKKFVTDQGNIEIYKFDTSSDAYKKAKDEGKLTLEGFGDFSVIVNGEYAMLSDDVPSTTIDLFTALK